MQNQSGVVYVWLRGYVRSLWDAGHLAVQQRRPSNGWRTY
jgi:hypothetical protein